MKYAKEERLDIGRQIYTGEMSRYEASEKYGININTARDYMRLYRDTYDLPAKRGTQKNYAVGQAAASAASLEELESMSKEELIRELIKARINEARLKSGDRMTYISGLQDLIKLRKQYPEYRMILHSDQGSVYTSKAFNELLPAYVARSMSRAGTPTDNAAMGAINGWIKAELFMDFHVTGERSVKEEVDDYITFFNEQRPAYSLNYLTLVQFRMSYAPITGVQ